MLPRWWQKSLLALSFIIKYTDLFSDRNCEVLTAKGIGAGVGKEVDHQAG